MALSGEWLTLRSDALTARIDPQGAQLSSLQDPAGNELLWQGDPAVWPGRAPILFPIVGTLAGGSYLHQGKRHVLPRHGFARGRRFSVVGTATGSALLRLAADAATLAVYPFHFELDVGFTLIDATLNVSATVRNTGDETLYASLGFHPGFQWPLPYGQPRAAHFLEFEVDETAPIRRITAAGLLSPVLHDTPVTNRRLVLNDALFRDDVVIFDRLCSQSLTYGSDDTALLRIEFSDATYLGLWSKPGARFICIEPWRGVADPDGFGEEFCRKPGSMAVPPGSLAALHMGIALLRRA